MSGIVCLIFALSTGSDRDDSLPPGAVLRLGNPRFNHPATPQLHHVSRDGKMLITVSWTTRSAIVWNLLTGERIREVPIEVDAPQFGFAWSPDDTQFITADPPFRQPTGGQTTIRIHDAKTGEILATKASTGRFGLGPFQIRFLSDGQSFALRRENTVVVYDRKTCAERAVGVMKGAATDYLIVPDDSETLANIGDKNTTIWNWKKNEIVATWAIPNSPAIRRSAYDAKRHRLFTENITEKRVVVTDTQTGRFVAEIRSPTPLKQVLTYAYAAATNRIYTTCLTELGIADHTTSARIDEFDAETGKHLRTFPGEVWPGELTLCDDGKTLVSTAVGFPRWDVATGMRTNDERFGDQVSFGRLFAAGNTIISSATGAKSVLWDGTTGAQRRNLTPSHQRMNFAISPDGSQFAVAGMDDRITMWDGKTATPLYSIPGHGEKMPPNVLGFTESGSELVSCGIDFSLRTTDVKTGKATREFRLERPKPTASQVAANRMTVSYMLNAQGSHLVIRGPERASLYDVKTGKVVLTWTVPKNQSRSATSALSRTGETMFLFERDDAQPDPGVPPARPRPLTAWNTATGEPIWRVELADAVVQAMHLSPDGQWIPIAISRPNGTCDLAFYSTQNGKEGGRIKAIPSAVRDAVFRADGKQIVVALSNLSALVYTVPVLQAPRKP